MSGSSTAAPQSTAASPPQDWSSPAVPVGHRPPWTEGDLDSWRDRSWIRALAFYVFLALVLFYAGWRLTQTLPAWSLNADTVAWWLYAGGECLLLLATVRLLALLRFRRDRRNEAARNMGWWSTLATPPQVDVLIPTYNEPPEVVEKGIIGAKQQRYAHCRIWVLDDGARPQIQALAAGLGVNYLARKEHGGAKAGNLNHAIDHLRTLANPPDFVAVLDADFVAQPEFLVKTLSLMVDEKIGLVQTPQQFYNPDPIQAAFPHRRAIADTFRLFHDVVSLAQDARGVAYCRGTSFLIRMKALEQIGKFATDSVCEDVLTSQRLRLRGWITAHLGEGLSFGLATESLTEFIRQTRRIVTGFCQVARFGWRAKEGRSWWSRVLILEAQLRLPMSFLLQVFMLTVPVFYWWLGLAPYRADAAQVLLHGLPLVLFYRAYITWFSQGRSLPLFRDATTLVAAFPAMAGGLGGFVRPNGHAFAVTRKGLTRGRLTIHWRLFAGLSVLLVATVGGAARALWARGGGGAEPLDWVMLLWSAYTALCAGIGLLICVERRNLRGEVRFPGKDEPVRFSFAGQEGLGRLKEISCKAAVIEAPSLNLTVGSPVQLALSGGEWLEARVVRATRGGGWVVEFVVTGAKRERLIRDVMSFRFVTPVVRGRFVDAGLAALVRLFGAARWLVRGARG